MTYNPTLLDLFCCSDYSSFVIGRPFSQPSCPFDLLWICCEYYLMGEKTYPYFLVLHDSPGSLCIFLTLVLESSTSPRSTGFFYQGIELESNIWALDMLIASKFIQPTEKGNICMGANS
jgi:hypothetical protein